MGVTCSCFGNSQSDRGGVAAGSEGLSGVKNSCLQNVINKLKSVSHKGQVENAVNNNGGSRNVARVAAAKPLRTNTTAASGASSVQCVAQPHQPTPLVNNLNSTNSQPTGLQHQTQNKHTTKYTGKGVTQKRKSKVRKGSKLLTKDTVKAKAFQSVDSSSEDFKDAVEIFSSADNEDVCPTCLEEYDEENPKIMPECNHHFHLSCIFEWMERSTLCPVCGKAMVFEQMT